MGKLIVRFWIRAFRCSFVEFQKWIIDCRMLILAVVLLFVNNYITNPLIENAVKFGSQINALEVYVALTNSGMVLLIMPLTFLVLIADFPVIDTNTVFYISRIDRKSWLTAQFLKLFMMVLFFEIVIFAGTIFTVLGRAQLTSSWSDVATKYVSKFPDEAYSYAVQLLPANMYHNLTVLEMVGKSSLYLGLYLFLLGAIQLVLSLFKLKALGFALNGLLISAGTVLCSFKIKAMWLMPMAHSIVWLHYDAYRRKPVMDEWISVAYFCGFILFILIISFIVIRKFNYDNVNEIAN